MLLSFITLSLQPSNLRVAQLAFDTVTNKESRFYGRNRCALKFFNNDDKKQKLSLAKPEIRSSEEGANDFVDDPDDPLCTYQCLIRHLANFPPGWQGHIFVRRAPQKTLAQRPGKGLSMSWLADFEPKDDTTSDPKGKFGKNAPNHYMQKIGKVCGFAINQSQKWSGRSARRSAISNQVSRRVAPAEIMATSRHGSIAMNVTYTERNQQTCDQRWEAGLKQRGPVRDVYVTC